MQFNIYKFKINDKYYVYDVNTNIIVEMDETAYNQLDNCYLESNQIKNLLNAGIMKKTYVKNISNPVVNNIDMLLDTKLSSLLLQVTQKCNLRCEYCSFSGKYNNFRTHNNKVMSEEIAYKLIDFFVSKSSSSPYLNIGFYGGEPLLNFELIKKTVNYIKSKYKYRKINYSITTNATLLNNEVAKFFYENAFMVNVSVDGPENIHNSNRKYLNGKGSYKDIENNLEYVFKKFPEYYKQKFSYNVVIDPELIIYEKLVSYFSNSTLFSGIKAKFSKINTVYNNTITISSKRKIENRLSEKKMEVLYYYAKLMKLTDFQQYDLLNQLFSGNDITASLDNTYFELPKNYTHCGICIPGVARLFANVDGDFFPCEKVDECSSCYNIGNIKEGFNKTAIIDLLDIGKYTKEECKKCWAIRLCDLCLAKIDINNIKENNFNLICNGIRRNIEKKLKIHVLLDQYDISKT